MSPVKNIEHMKIDIKLSNFENEKNIATEDLKIGIIKILQMPSLLLFKAQSK